MIKTLNAVIKQDREKFKIPRSVQDIIPIHTIWKNGIMKVGRNKYAMTWKFEDINFAIASKEDKENMFLAYSELINSFDSGATYKITINNRELNAVEFAKKILMRMNDDDLDKYRIEYNENLIENATSGDSIVQDRYITVSVNKRNITEARNFFKRTGTDLIAHLARLNSKCVELDAVDKLHNLYDFYRNGEEADFQFDMLATMRKGHSFKDYICPDSIEIEQDYFKIGSRYGRVVYLKEYANFISDKFLSELCELNKNLMLSIDIVPIPTDEAVREIENRMLGVETNITNWQRKQNNNNNWSAVIPYDMELQRKESKDFLNDLTTRDQRMMFAVITMMHTADSKEQLDIDTDSLLTTARKKLCQLAILRFQQLDGLNTVLPFGVKKINALRTLNTESLAVFMPFKVQEIMEDDGIYFGQNAISHNLLLCNKQNLMNANSFILGVPGSGKSFNAKEQIVFLALSTNDDILICDPEEEYCELIQELHGEIIRIAAGSKDHINAMDMVDGYGDGRNPIKDKAEFILSLFEQLDKEGINGKQRSIIDRCVRNVYKKHRKGGPYPTLITLREELLNQPEKEAQELALSLEIFTEGSLDAFAHETNVDTKNRMIVYDIYDLGKQLKTMGLLVITDAMINRVTKNFKAGRRTHVFIDEFHVVFENDHSGEFFSSAWRRFRKRDAFPTGITQNIEYLLDSVLASTMLSNSECIVMLNQAPSDREQLSKLLNISTEQLDFITNADAGCGLLKYGSSLVPFINQWPKNTELYKLMTTKPSDKTEKGDSTYEIY